MIVDELKEVAERYPNIRWDDRFWNDVGPGWVDLVEHTMENLAKVLGEDNMLHVYQVKEKFGMLSIYTEQCENTIIQPLIDRILREAMQESMKTCEKCGKPGALQEVYKGLFLSICDDCRLLAY